MSTESEVVQDPAGYVPRADLYARNLTRQPVTFNVGLIRWFLDAKGNPGERQPLPWTVAQSVGFTNIWQREDVEVALDQDFNRIITHLPDLGHGGSGPGSSAFIFRQEVPQSVVDIAHNFDRPGPVHVAVFSLDYQVEYWNFYTDIVSGDVCRLTFEDPTTFIATVS